MAKTKLALKKKRDKLLQERQKKKQKKSNNKKYDTRDSEQDHKGQDDGEQQQEKEQQTIATTPSVLEKAPPDQEDTPARRRERSTPRRKAGRPKKFLYDNDDETDVEEEEEEMMEQTPKDQEESTDTEAEDDGDNNENDEEGDEEDDDLEEEEERRIQEYEEEMEYMSTVSFKIRQRFQKIGFGVWGRRRKDSYYNWLPVLEISPYDLAEGPVRQQWKKYYSSYKDGKRTTMPHLVYWYGVPIDRASEGFAFLETHSFVPYEEGMKRNLDKLPKQTQEKMTQGKKLCRWEEDLLNGFEDFHMAAKLPKEYRTIFPRTNPPGPPVVQSSQDASEDEEEEEEEKSFAAEENEEEDDDDEEKTATTTPFEESSARPSSKKKDRRHHRVSSSTFEGHDDEEEPDSDVEEEDDDNDRRCKKESKKKKRKSSTPLPLSSSEQSEKKRKKESSGGSGGAGAVSESAVPNELSSTHDNVLVHTGELEQHGRRRLGSGSDSAGVASNKDNDDRHTVFARTTITQEKDPHHPNKKSDSSRTAHVPARNVSSSSSSSDSSAASCSNTNNGSTTNKTQNVEASEALSAGNNKISVQSDRPSSTNNCSGLTTTNQKDAVTATIATTAAHSSSVTNSPTLTPSSQSQNNHDYFQTMYQKLLHYKARYGDCNVPVAFEDRALSKFVLNMRAHYKKREAGHVSTKVSEEEFNLLQQMGFAWRVKPGRRRPLSSCLKQKSPVVATLPPSPTIGGGSGGGLVVRSTNHPSMKQKLHNSPSIVGAGAAASVGAGAGLVVTSHHPSMKKRSSQSLSEGEDTGTGVGAGVGSVQMLVPTEDAQHSSFLSHRPNSSSSNGVSHYHPTREQERMTAAIPESHYRDGRSPSSTTVPMAVTGGSKVNKTISDVTGDHVTAAAAAAVRTVSTETAFMAKSTAVPEETITAKLATTTTAPAISQVLAPPAIVAGQPSSTIPLIPTQETANGDIEEDAKKEEVAEEETKEPSTATTTMAEDVDPLTIQLVSQLEETFQTDNIVSALKSIRDVANHHPGGSVEGNRAVLEILHSACQSYKQRLMMSSSNKKVPQQHQSSNDYRSTQSQGSENARQPLPQPQDQPQASSLARQAVVQPPSQTQTQQQQQQRKSAAVAAAQIANTPFYEASSPSSDGFPSSTSASAAATTSSVSSWSLPPSASPMVKQLKSAFSQPKLQLGSTTCAQRELPKSSASAARTPAESSLTSSSSLTPSSNTGGTGTSLSVVSSQHPNNPSNGDISLSRKLDHLLLLKQQQQQRKGPPTASSTAAPINQKEQALLLAMSPPSVDMKNGSSSRKDEHFDPARTAPATTTNHDDDLEMTPTTEQAMLSVPVLLHPTVLSPNRLREAASLAALKQMHQHQAPPTTTDDDDENSLGLRFRRPVSTTAPDSRTTDKKTSSATTMAASGTTATASVSAAKNTVATATVAI